MQELAGLPEASTGWRIPSGPAFIVSTQMAGRIDIH